MPIDFAAIAAAFAEALGKQITSSELAGKGIGSFLSKRLSTARALELETRSFPVVRFYNEAVTMRIASSQKDALSLVAPDPSFGERLARGGLGFLEGVTAVADIVRQERAIPRLLGSIERSLDAVTASIRRLESPTSDMFDPRQRTASDLFGLAVLAFRTLADASRRGTALQARLPDLPTASALGDARRGPGRGQGPPSAVEVLTEQVRSAMHATGMTPADELQGSQGATGPARTPVESIDAAGSQVMAGIAVLGMLPGLMDTIARGLSIRLHDIVLDVLEGVLGIVRELRAEVMDRLFGTIPGRLTLALLFVTAARNLLTDAVAGYTAFARAYAAELLGAIARFSRQIVEFVDGVLDILRFVPHLVTAAFGYDLTLLLRPKLGRIVDYLPALAITDLLDSSGRNVNHALRRALELGVTAAEVLVDRIPLAARLVPSVRRFVAKTRRQLLLVRRLLRALFPGMTFLRHPSGRVEVLTGPDWPAEAAAFRPPAAFPDLGVAVFGAGRHEAILGHLERAGASVGGAVSAAAARASTRFSVIAGQADAAAAAARPPSRRLIRVAAQADRLAEQAFGAEVAGQLTLAEGARSRVAASYESWLVSGGFEVVGRVIPAYVREVATRWREQVAQGTEVTAPVTLTSPHILLRHATVGRVELPRLSLRGEATERLDEDFAERVAVEFRAAVEQAYTTGVERLRAMAAATAPAAG